jgi:MFS family permease
MTNLDTVPGCRVVSRPNADLRNSLVLTAFTAATNLADGVMKVALPLLATRLTSSPVEVTGVALTLSLPWLLTALPVGVLVDRTNRRTLLISANAGRVAALSGLSLAVATGSASMPVLYAAGVTLGVAEVVALTAASALVPSVVTRKGQERVNAWMTAAETVCNDFCGPFVGGILVAVGYAFALGASGTAFLLTLLLPLLLVGRLRIAADPAASAATRARVAEGLIFILRHPLLRTLAFTLMVLCMCWGAWLALIPLLATRVLHLSPAAYGLVLSALGVGGFTGAASSAPLVRLVGRRWLLFADLLGTFAMVAAPALGGNAYAIAACAFLGGMGGTLWTVNTRTLTQRLVSPEAMGRFYSSWRLFSWGALPLGAAIIGGIAEVVGLRLAFAPFAVAAAITVLPFLRVITPSAVRAAEGT